MAGPGEIPAQLSQLQIIHYPDPRLRRAAAAVRQFDRSLAALARRMIELMTEAKGVGLAGPQVGVMLRLFVANPTGEPDDSRIFINPTLETGGEPISKEEGCLSIPQVYGPVVRPERAVITAQDLDGDSFTLESDPLPARVWQHEADHLDGRLMIDRFSRATRITVRKLLAELEEKYERK